MFGGAVEYLDLVESPSTIGTLGQAVVRSWEVHRRPPGTNIPAAFPAPRHAPPNVMENPVSS